MLPEALQYVQNLLKNTPLRLANNVRDRKNRALPLRAMYFHLLEMFQNPSSDLERWILLYGLRGVGKTTLLSQLFCRSFNEALLQGRAIYVPVDELVSKNYNIDHLLQVYEHIRGESFESLQQPLYLLFDEVQYDPQWGLTLKSFYDKNKNIFIYATGSSSIDLQTNPDIARRCTMKLLCPLSFSEYHHLKPQVLQLPATPLTSSVEDNLKPQNRFHVLAYNFQNLFVSILCTSQTSQQAFDRFVSAQTLVNQCWGFIDRLSIATYYQQGGLPHLLELSNPNATTAHIQQLVDKIIFYDLKTSYAFDINTLHMAKKLLLILAASTSEVSLQKMSQITGLNKNTLARLLDAFVQTELLTRIEAYGGAAMRSKKTPKYLFASPSLRASLLGAHGKESGFYTTQGAYLEDLVGLWFKRNQPQAHSTYIYKPKQFKLWAQQHAPNLQVRDGQTPKIDMAYDSQHGGADFILKIGSSHQIVIEMGRGNKTARQAAQSLQKTNSHYALVICDTPLKHEASKKIIYLPTDFFLVA